ncbi:hypothetical protein C4K38_4476 [Pseudomonas chlororaphis subsp. piscium]|nr:hypothetical protein C4K38_4476 [Pseudomonas chlororaphis subsp. piscium]
MCQRCPTLDCMRMVSSPAREDGKFIALSMKGIARFCQFWKISESGNDLNPIAFAPQPLKKSGF